MERLNCQQWDMTYIRETRKKFIISTKEYETSPNSKYGESPVDKYDNEQKKKFELY